MKYYQVKSITEFKADYMSLFHPLANSWDALIGLRFRLAALSGMTDWKIFNGG